MDLETGFKNSSLKDNKDMQTDQKYLFAGWSAAEGDFLSELKAVVPGEYMFAQSIDYIFVGTCSRAHGRGFFPQCVLPGGEPASDLFDGGNGIPDDAKVILMVSNCCGQYRESFQTEVRKRFPQITWLFPDHGDFMEDNVPVKVLADNLVKAGILSVK